MNRLSDITNLLKKIYRDYSNFLIIGLAAKGFNDLRPSFIEILVYLSEKERVTIKEIGRHCGLKKQTMTSHLNELERRGYITREPSLDDKREIFINLTEYGKKFKMTLAMTISSLEKKYLDLIGENELERINLSLGHFYQKMTFIKNNTL